MVWFILSFVLWAVLHSITAAASFKSRVRHRVGDAVYEGTFRFLYNVFASITFLPALYFLAVAVPNTVLWQVSAPVGILFVIIQLGGVIGLLVSLWQTDVWSFAGLRQLVNWWYGRADAVPPPQLVTTGAYRLVRHPLYFFSLLFIWFTPAMTLNTLIFNTFVTLYFWIGSRYEEQRLLADFGEAYVAYRQQTPGLLPFKL
ncbi:MAG: methyltransferase family protein [Anaerolineae bacterium]